MGKSPHPLRWVAGISALLAVLLILGAAFALVPRESEEGGTGLEAGDLAYLFSSWERLQRAPFLFDSAERAKAFATGERNRAFAKEIRDMGLSRAVQLGIVGTMRGDIWDSLRHAHWAIDIARKYGPGEALTFLQEYHERSGNATPEQFLQDTYTHYAAILYDGFGRLDPTGGGRMRPTAEVVLEMKERGWLRTARDFRPSHPRNQIIF